MSKPPGKSSRSWTDVKAALAALDRAERVAKEAGAVATQERKLRETEAEKSKRLEQEKLKMEQEQAAKQRAREQQAGSLIKDL